MKINDMRKNSIAIFDELACGDSFLFLDRLFMKVGEVEDHDTGEVFNAWDFRATVLIVVMTLFM